MLTPDNETRREGPRDFRATPPRPVRRGASGERWHPDRVSSDRGRGRRPSPGPAPVTRTTRGHCRRPWPDRRRRVRTARKASRGPRRRAPAAVGDRRPERAAGDCPPPTSSSTTPISTRTAPLPYLTALSRSAQRTWSSWSASATASHAADVSRRSRSRSTTASASQARCTRGADGQDIGLRTDRLRVEAADDQQLLDHPRQPVRLLRDDRQTWVDGCRRIGDQVRLRQRVGVRTDPGERRLQVVADAAQEVILDLAQRPELGVLRLDLIDQLGVPDGDSDLDREQVQQRLVGPLPRPGRRQAREEEAPSARRRPGVRPGWAPRRPGSAPPASTESGSTNNRTAAMNPNAFSASRAARSASASSPSRGSAASTAARISPSCQLRRAASSARRLWLSASWAMTSLPSTGIGRLMSPADTRATAAEISRSGADEREHDRGTADDRDDDDHRQDEQEQAGPDLRLDRTERDEQAPEDGQWDGRCGEEDEGHSGLERQAESTRLLVWSVGPRTCHLANGSTSGSRRPAVDTRR